jgi:hydrogenase expression/formation protein HypE
MGHGAGGTLMRALIKTIFVRHLGGSLAEVPLEALDDAAVIDDIVLTSDSHTVKPLFFPGGDIGRLAVAGTVNDIAVLGATPRALTAGFVIEDGFPLADLETIVQSMASTCRSAGVHVLTGDTKVMERGALDQFIVNTSGIGTRPAALDANIAEVRRHRPFTARWLLDANLARGDNVIVSGTLGDHGVALLSFREGYDFGSTIESDVAPLNRLILKLLEVGGIVAMKDPTRGGLANTLNEWSAKSRIGILVTEDRIPIREGVRAACEMLGIDPLEVGNEGKVVLAVVPQKADDVLATLRATEAGRDAAIIGSTTDQFRDVVLETEVGGTRILPPPIGDPVPRIC